MAFEIFKRRRESIVPVSRRGLRIGLYLLTVLFVGMTVLREWLYGSFFQLWDWRDFSGAAFLLTVAAILVWGFTVSTWLVLGLQKRDEQARAYEERIQQLRRTFEDLVEHYPHGILIFDRDGNLLQANPAAVRLLGQLFPTDYNILRDPAWLSEGRGHAVRDAVSGKLTSLVPWRRRVAGTEEELVLRTTFFALFDDKQHVTHIVALHEDISEQQSLEEQLLHAQKMESVGTLAGGVAHDFNNILQAILGNVSLIKQRLADPVSLGRYADSIEQSARRAANLTGQLLTFARVAPQQMRPIDLNHCVENSMKLLAASLDKNIHVESNLAPGLWSVMADPSQIEQAIMNLCINARDAMPNGGSITVTTENLPEHSAAADRSVVRHMARRGKGVVALTVRDTGTGMDETTRQRVFEPFFTTKPPGKGTGLGAAMVYAITQKHGGNIEVASQLGQGTMFRLYFPASTQPAVEPPQTRVVSAPTGKERILVVDDEAEVLASLQEGLQRFGYHVITAHDGVDAINVFQRHVDEIDIVVLDMIMPRADGLAALQGILKIRPKTKVILSSAYSRTAQIEAALAAGARRLVQKPYTADKLAQAIREEMDGSRLDKAISAA